MTNILLKLFIKDSANLQKPKTRAAVGALSGYVGIICNLLLFAGKLLVGTVSGSISITADAMNNLSDASGAIVTLLGFKLAEKPADPHHPYGHARYEYLSGLAVAVMIILIGFELAKSSVEKILHPSSVEFSALTAGVLLSSIALKLWLSRFNTKLGNAISSTTLLAAAADSRNDCIATGSVLLAGVIGHFVPIPIDGFMGLGVALFILFSGWNLAKQTISPLLGESASPQLRQRIVDYIETRPYVLGFHDLMVHDYGPGQRFATLHVEMDKNEDPLVCHALIDDMERECLRSHNVHLVIHYDPVITDDPELLQLKEKISSLLRQRDERLSLHDFRTVAGKVHQNLIFDVTLPFDLRGQEGNIRQWVEEAMNAETPGAYHILITFDTES